jgi:hypothetical protein
MSWHSEERKKLKTSAVYSCRRSFALVKSPSHIFELITKQGCDRYQGGIFEWLWGEQAYFGSSNHFYL